ncbi:hypothetical protein [Streptomyces brasiliscabiei]|uniref:hypothetical protein n=1 Tax=Streptomyces brasiliscabiei TaxID=2736302 RepID=UPI001C1084A8|nr:hypothetical protein [Streptomyces brasiliscabiei]
MSRASRTTRSSRPTAAALTLLSAAALLSLTACSSSGDAGADREPARAAERSPAQAKAIAEAQEGGTPRELAEQALDPLTDRVVLRQNRTRNGAHLEFDKARQGEGKALTVVVSCEGEGTIEVALRPLGASFPMDCLEGEVSSIQNVFAVDEAARAGTVSVTGPSSVQWSLAIGRDR